MRLTMLMYCYLVFGFGDLRFQDHISMTEILFQLGFLATVTLVNHQQHDK